MGAGCHRAASGQRIRSEADLILTTFFVRHKGSSHGKRNYLNKDLGRVTAGKNAHGTVWKFAQGVRTGFAPQSRQLLAWFCCPRRTGTRYDGVPGAIFLIVFGRDNHNK